jgi:histidinol-phosphate aminotransferase
MNRRSFVHTLGAGAVGLIAPLSHGATLRAADNETTPATAPPDGTGLIRIGGNENPYGPAQSVLDAAQIAARDGHRYAGSMPQELIQKIAKTHDVPDNAVLLSGGSGDVLRAVVTAFTGSMKGLVIGSPSYEAPVRIAQRVRAPLREIPLDPALRLDLGAMAARASGAGLVYICNPNNPSSTAVTAADVEAFVDTVVKASPSTRILVDEAYLDYADRAGVATAIPLAMKYPQVIVVRTFSKIHAMAGMRAGYAIARPKTLELIRDYHSGSAVSVMTMAAAMAALGDAESLARNHQLNRDVRKATVAAFEQAGYRVAQSDANFVFVNIRCDAREFQDLCRRRGIAIGRPFPPLISWARISLGTSEEMDRAIPVILAILASAVETQARS